MYPRQYSRNITASLISSGEVLLTDKLLVTTTTNGYVTAKTFTLQPSDLLTTTFKVRKVQVTWERSVKPGSNATTKILLNGVLMGDQNMSATANTSYDVSFPINPYQTNVITIQIGSDGSTATEIANAVVSAKLVEYFG